jgi:DNA ligase-1
MVHVLCSNIITLFILRWLSEKLDGVRAYWNGSNLISKNSKTLYCPNWFTEGLPSGISLDGELWMGRGKLENTMATLNSSDINESSWKDMKYMIFDLVGCKKPIEDRMKEMEEMKSKLPSHIEVLKRIECTGNDELIELLKEIIENGGEGLMVNKPQSIYIGERTRTILKVKVNIFF